MVGGGEPFWPFPHGVLLDECSAGLCPERLGRVKGLNPLSGLTLYPVQTLQPVLQHHRKCQYASVTYCVTYRYAFQQQPSDP